MEAEVEGIIGSAQFNALQQMSPGSKLTRLSAIAAELEDRNEIAIVQRFISSEFDKVRTPLDENSFVTPPDVYDVLLMDIKPEDFFKISRRLGVEPLSIPTSVPSFPAHGIIYGSCHRLFISLVVKKRSISLNVNFLYDTGSPYTYLRAETLKALGFTENVPEDADVLIHGCATTVYPSTKHFAEVDILGQEYVNDISAAINISFLGKAFTLTRE